MLGLEPFVGRTACVLVFVAAFAAIAVYGELLFAWKGFLMQLTSCICESLKIVIQNKLMARGGKLDPLTLVLCTSPLTCFSLLPALYVFWDSRIATLLHTYWPLLLCNGLVAFLLNVVIAITIRGVSGVGLTFASIVKDLAIVAVSSWLFSNKLSGLQIMGFAGTLLGISLYSAMKLFPERFIVGPSKEVANNEP